MRATEFITEAEVKPYNSRVLGIEEAKALMDQHCTEARPMLESPIWRGMSNHKEAVVLLNPSSGIRKSQNTTNFYTMLIDSSPYMQGWPKRSNSLICTTDENYASEFVGYSSRAQLYAIFPVDGAKIAVCPKRDMWDTPVRIPEFKVSFTGGGNMYEFNNWLSEYGITEKNLASAHEELYLVQSLCKRYNVDPKQFIPILQKALSPAKTGFKLMTVPQFIAAGVTNSSREVWISDNVVAISATMRDQMMETSGKQ